MNAVLGGQFVSRVNLKLREEKAYTYGARTSFDWRRGMSPFVLQTSVHTASTADAIADSLAEIAGLRGTRPPTDEELKIATAAFAVEGVTRRAATEDVLWSLLNSAEFVFNH